jgi:hypothetical protein
MTVVLQAPYCHPLPTYLSSESQKGRLGVYGTLPVESHVSPVELRELAKIPLPQGSLLRTLILAEPLQYQARS